MSKFSKMIAFLRHAKHVLYYKIKHWYLYLRYFEWTRDVYQSFFPMGLDRAKIEGSFLINSVGENYANQEVPKNIYIIWAGSNDMPSVRKDAVKSITQYLSGFEIITVTPRNLHQFIDEVRPLHPMYEKLSYVHRSDYLRVYLLWAHGGGYTDIKKPKNNWESVFYEFSSSDTWIAGYPEIVFKMISESEPFGKDLKKMSSKMIGQGAFIARPKNPFLEEWLNEMDRRLDLYAEQLTLNPGNAYGTNDGYPLAWTELLADVLHPLCAKYSGKVFRDKRLLFEYKGIGHR